MNDQPVLTKIMEETSNCSYAIRLVGDVSGNSVFGISITKCPSIKKKKMQTSQWMTFGRTRNLRMRYFPSLDGFSTCNLNNLAQRPLSYVHGNAIKSMVDCLQRIVAIHWPPNPLSMGRIPSNIMRRPMVSLHDLVIHMSSLIKFIMLFWWFPVCSCFWSEGSIAILGWSQICCCCLWSH